MIYITIILCGLENERCHLFSRYVKGKEKKINNQNFGPICDSINVWLIIIHSDNKDGLDITYTHGNCRCGLKTTKKVHHVKNLPKNVRLQCSMWHYNMEHIENVRKCSFPNFLRKWIRKICYCCIVWFIHINIICIIRWFIIFSNQ